jgi:hypothetical protein
MDSDVTEWDLLGIYCFFSIVMNTNSGLAGGWAAVCLKDPSRCKYPDLTLPMWHPLSKSLSMVDPPQVRDAMSSPPAACDASVQTGGGDTRCWCTVNGENVSGDSQHPDYALANGFKGSKADCQKRCDATQECQLGPDPVHLTQALSASAQKLYLTSPADALHNFFLDGQEVSSDYDYKTTNVDGVGAILDAWKTHFHLPDKFVNKMQAFCSIARSEYEGFQETLAPAQLSVAKHATFQETAGACRNKGGIVSMAFAVARISVDVYRACTHASGHTGCHLEPTGEVVCEHSEEGYFMCPNSNTKLYISDFQAALSPTAFASFDTSSRAWCASVYDGGYCSGYSKNYCTDEIPGCAVGDPIPTPNTAPFNANEVEHIHEYMQASAWSEMNAAVTLLNSEILYPP